MAMPTSSIDNTMPKAAGASFHALTIAGDAKLTDSTSESVQHAQSDRDGHHTPLKGGHRRSVEDLAGIFRVHRSAA